MLPPEVLEKIISYLDFKNLVSLSEVNQELGVIAKRKIVNMKNIIGGTYVNFRKISKARDEDLDLWEMKKIVISNDLMFQNLHSWSTDFSFLYDKLVGEFTLDGDSAEFLSLPPDGYLRYESDNNLDIIYTLNMQADSSCKLVMTGMGDKGKAYSRTMVSTKDGALHQTVKLEDEEEVRQFHQIQLDSSHFLIINNTDFETDLHPTMVYMSSACLSAMKTTWPHLIRLKGPRKKMIVQVSAWRMGVRDQHILVNRNFRESLGLERGEVVELEICPFLPSGQMELKVISARRLYEEETQVDFGHFIRMFLEQFPGGVVFNEGATFEVHPELSSGVFSVQFQVTRTNPSPACMVETGEQVRVVVT